MILNHVWKNLETTTMGTWINQTHSKFINNFYND